LVTPQSQVLNNQGSKEGKNKMTVVLQVEIQTADNASVLTPEVQQQWAELIAIKLSKYLVKAKVGAVTPLRIY
jgi:hypothetical protein